MPAVHCVGRQGQKPFANNALPFSEAQHGKVSSEEDAFLI